MDDAKSNCEMFCHKQNLCVKGFLKEGQCCLSSSQDIYN